jgi:hypothetical protein
MNELPEAKTVLTEQEKKELLVKLRDPLWRVCNLYMIVDKDGKTVPFRPTKPQLKVAHAYYREGKKRHCILKARRMGFSTLIDVMAFDETYWAEDTIQASIVDLSAKDASEKLRSKCRFAWEHLPQFLRKLPARDNEQVMEFDNGSTIYAGKNARGGTNQFLHISEWGPIAHTDPKRSEEIKTGALPSADRGAIFIESTFKGGKGGHFYEVIKNAMETPAEMKTEKDFWFWFFPWYEDETLTLEGDARAVSPEIHRYMDQKERELGVKFTPGQRLWYHVTKREQGIFMFREYPTTVDEAFQAPVEGAIYGDIISRMRAAGQVKDFLHDTAFPIFAVMDIGWSDNTTAWLFQVVGREVHWLRYLSVRHKTAAEFWRMLAETGLPISGCFLPWDSKATAASVGVSYKGEFEKAGAPNVVVLPPTREMWAGINCARDMLGRSYVHATGCKLGVESLEAYHTKDTSSGGAVSKEPVHDWSSHGSDAFRYGCEAITLGLVKTKAATRLGAGLVPDLPSGSIVDIDAVREARKAQRNNGRARDDFRL